MTNLPYHPIANLFPLIEGEDFSRLVADINENGLQEKIVLHDGAILDGRNRYRVLVALDRFNRLRDTIDFSHLAFTHAAPRDPLAWVLSKNLHRRHLSESQRAMVATRLESFEHGGKRGTGSDGEATADAVGEAQNADLHLDRKRAAEMMNVSPRSVASASKVVSHGAPELAEAVDKGDIAVSAAADLADLPVARQTEIIRNADPAALYTVIKEERAKKQAEKKARRAEREQSLATRQMALPHKRYGVIYADPEWKFEPYSRETGLDRAADNHYPTSELADIKARDVAAIAADDCVLFLWATAPMLPQALDVMASWGFAYKSHTIWRKAEIDGLAGGDRGKIDRGRYSGALMLGTGYWFRNGHELLLVGTRGKVVAPAMGEQFPSVIDHPALRHSEKPARFAEVIEAYFPNLPKIELNARATRSGWDAWGLEAPDTETAPSSDNPQEGQDAQKGISGGESRAEDSASPLQRSSGVSATPPDSLQAKSEISPSDRPDNPESEAVHDGSSSGIEARPADESASPEAAPPHAASTTDEINTIITEGYARDASITELMALTGLGRSAVKMRVKRLGLSDPERQREAARQNMTKLNAERGGAA